MISPILVPPAVLGVLSHILYFQRGEHHLHAPLYAKIFLGTLATLIPTLQYTLSLTWPTALTLTAQLTSSYLAGLYTSLLLYRALLHPLNRFPGPLGARISSLWTSIQLKNHDLYKKLHKMHNTHGPFVRTGSSDLSIIHPKAIDALYGPSTPCSKAIWYDFSHPVTSLQTMRDKPNHRARRRVWSSAFSDKAVRGYEQRIRVYRQQLITELSARKGTPIDMRKWFNLYSFDVMGDLAFGEGFGSVQRGEDHWAIQILNSAVGQMGLYLPTWLYFWMTQIPGLSGPFLRFLEFSGKKLQHRIENPPKIPDISTALIAHLDGRIPTKEEHLLLDGDSRLIIVAGSDTTAGTLASIFYELARHPEEITKLREELAPYIEADAGGEFLHSKIQHLDHLNGIINEALRLYPAVPAGLQRLTPPEGIEVDGVFIPGNMTVYCPLYVMGRSELSYERPYEFIPERWYKSPELVKDKSAFAPFTIGAHACIGKPLALLNLRTTLARLIMTFDIAFAPGEDGSKFLDEAYDNFVLYMGELKMVLNKREVS